MLNLDYANIYQKGEQLYGDLGLGNIPAIEYEGDIENDLRALWQSKHTAPADRMDDGEISEASRIIFAYLENIHEWIEA